MATETQEAIHGYITDMLALEEHIEKALQAQVSAHEDEHATVAAALRDMHSTIEGHIAALRALSIMSSPTVRATPYSLSSSDTIPLPAPRSSTRSGSTISPAYLIPMFAPSR